MSDAVHLVDENGFLIQDGNPVPVDSPVGSVLEENITKLHTEESLATRILSSDLGNIIKELKKTNMYLANMANVGVLTNADIN